MIVFQTNCIFSIMRLRIYIVTMAWGMVFSGLHIQPLFVNYNVGDEQVCTNANKPACAKSDKCQEDTPDEEKDDCNNKGCNPFFTLHGKLLLYSRKFLRIYSSGFYSKTKNGIS